MATIEELFDRLVELKKEEADKIWEQAGLVALLKLKHQVKAGDIAAQIGVSSAYINQLAKTFQAFPDESMRARDLSFSHHKLAAKTENPEEAIDKALANGWSIREFEKALRGEPIESISKAEKAWSSVLKIIEGGGEEASWLQQQIHEYALSL